MSKKTDQPDETAPNKEHTCNHQHCSCHDKVDYFEMAQRIAAEFDNYKKRNKDIVRESFNNGVAVSVEKLLPVLDSFKGAKHKITDPAVLDGIDLIYSQLQSALSSLGVTKIECLGKPFDPHYHNAVMTDSIKDQPDGIVLDELQEGFMLGDKVIRYSVVKINKH